MLANYLLILFWLVAYVTPVGHYPWYMKPHSDTWDIYSDIMPDNPIRRVTVSRLVVSVPPTRSSGPRFTPIATPVSASSGKQSEVLGTQFIHCTHIKPIYKFAGGLIDRFANLLGRPRSVAPRPRPRPTPTRFYVPDYTAPPTRSVEHTYTVPRYTSEFDPAALWSKYKLLVGWAAFTYVSVVITFIRFAARAPPSKPKAPSHAAPEQVPLPEPTEEELIALDTSSSALVNVAAALSADIDTKSRVEGSTEMNGTLTGGKILEPAVSDTSIEYIIDLYAQIQWNDSERGLSSAGPLPALDSQDSIDVQMGVLLGEQERMVFDQPLGARYDAVPVLGLVPTLPTLVSVGVQAVDQTLRERERRVEGRKWVLFLLGL